MDDVLIEKGKLPPNHVYVGQGRGSHRLAKTKWASPVIPGLNSQSNDWLWHYVAHIYESGLVNDLRELQGKVLVCDCPFCDPCEADVLAGLCFEKSQPRGRQTMHRFSRGGTPPARQVIVTGSDQHSTRHPSESYTLVEPGSPDPSFSQAVPSPLPTKMGPPSWRTCKVP